MYLLIISPSLYHHSSLPLLSNPSFTLSLLPLLFLRPPLIIFVSSLPCSSSFLPFHYSLLSHLLSVCPLPFLPPLHSSIHTRLSKTPSSLPFQPSFPPFPLLSLSLLSSLDILYPSLFITHFSLVSPLLPMSSSFFANIQ